MMDPKLMALLGDRRLQCFMKIIKGGECESLKIDKDKLLACDREEVEKVYGFLREFNALRKQGYDVVCKLVELANRLRSENVKDLAVAVSTMISVMFGREISKEDAEKIGSIIDVFRCIRFNENWIEVDHECIERSDAPEGLKDQIRTVTVANLVWSV